MLKKPSKQHIFPLLLVFYETIIYLSNDMYLPALPKITADFATTHHFVQLTLTSWFLGYASMPTLLGPLSDRYGRRPVLLIGGVVFVLATLGCALAMNVQMMIVARFFQGTAVASMMVPGYAVIHELFDHKKAIQVLAWMASIMVLAASFGPLWGSMLLYFVSWHWIFVILMVLGSAALIGLYFKMPETNVSGDQHPIQCMRLIKQYGRVLSNAEFLRNSLSLSALTASMIAWIAAGPFLVISQFHYSEFAYGIVQACVFGNFILGTRLAKRLMDKYTTSSLVKTGLSIAFAGGVLATVGSYFYPHQLIGTIIAMMLLSLGSGLAYPILNRLSIESSKEPMGARVATFSSLAAFFCVMGSGMISSFYDGSLSSFAHILIFFVSIAFFLKVIIPYIPFGFRKI